MKCPICDSTNPSESKYCGRCGVQLDAHAEALQDQIRAVIRSELKSQPSVEVEIAENILKRLITWTKVFSAAVGIPLTLLVTIFSILGWHSFSEATRDIKTAELAAVDDINKQHSALGAQTVNLESESRSLQTRFQKLLVVADNDEALTQQVKSLQRAVNHIEAAKFEQVTALDPGRAAELETLLQRYQHAMAALGYVKIQAAVTVHIIPDDSDPSRFAYFDLPTQSIWLEKRATGDGRNMLREYTQILIEGSDTNLAPDFFAPVWAIESGLADYLSSSFMNDPQPGRYGSAPLTSLQPWDKNPVDAFSGRTKRGWAFASICWNLRTLVGHERADRVLLKTWLASKADYGDAQFDSLYAQRVAADLGEYRSKAEAIFERAHLLP